MTYALSRSACTSDAADETPPVDLDDPATVLWAALLDAPENGRSVRELMTAVGMGRTWVYARLQDLAAEGPDHSGRPRTLGRHRTGEAQVNESSTRTSAAGVRP